MIGFRRQPRCELPGRSRLRARGSEERGAVTLLVAGMLVAILGMAALAIDLGSFYKAKRQAQSAADAGALAGADVLTAGTNAAYSTGTDYATTNYPGATVSVTTGTSSTGTSVQVTVTATTPTYFGQLFGLPTETVKATAAAAAGGTSPAAIFAADTNCGGIGVKFDGSSDNIQGGVHSNGSLTIAGGNSAFGPTTYGGTGGVSPPKPCGWSDGGSTGITFGGASTPTLDPNVEPWPNPYLSFQQNTQHCDQTAQYFDFGRGQTPLQNNTVYCATGQDQNGYGIFVTGKDTTATGVTFVAETANIGFSGKNMSFTPNPTAGGLLLYQGGTGIMRVAGQGFLKGGALFAPRAEIEIDGAGSGGSGFIEAQDVYFNGGSNSFSGTGPPMGSSGAILVQ